MFLFGSRARGHCEHSSDLDIGIAGPGPLPGGVSRLTDRLLDSDVPWRPQVVDFALVTDDDFRRRAYEGLDVPNSPKAAIKAGLDRGVVLESEYQVALDMIADRNTCSHVYRQAIAARIPFEC